MGIAGDMCQVSQGCVLFAGNVEHLTSYDHSTMYSITIYLGQQAVINPIS